MARLHHGRCHLGSRRRCCGVTAIGARVEPGGAQIKVPVRVSIVTAILRSGNVTQMIFQMFCRLIKIGVNSTVYIYLHISQ